jgi:hypothetical protein
MLPGHWDGALHGAPALLPPLHRVPPQTPGCPPLIGQSAFVAQGPPPRLLHVSQRHFRLPKPDALQFGLELERVRLWAPVDKLRRSWRLPIFPAGSGGQSKLVLPKSGLVPFTVQDRPIRGPSEQVAVVPKGPVPQMGHG